MLSFKPVFPLSSFTFIKRLFSSSSLLPLKWYYLHIWSCWYFSWQSWFQLVIHQASYFTWYILHICPGRSNQSILREINPKHMLEGLMLKLKLQYFGHLMWTADSLEKSLMLGKIQGRRRGWQRTRWLDGITDSMDMGLGGLREVGDGQGGLVCCGS